MQTHKPADKTSENNTTLTDEVLPAEMDRTRTRLQTEHRWGGDGKPAETHLQNKTFRVTEATSQIHI